MVTKTRVTEWDARMRRRRSIDVIAACQEGVNEPSSTSGWRLSAILTHCQRSATKKEVVGNDERLADGIVVKGSHSPRLSVKM